MSRIYEIEENEFRQLVEESTSITDFLKRIGMGRGANATENFKRRCLELDISLDHFNKRRSKIDDLSDEEFICLIEKSSSYKAVLDALGLATGRDPYNKIKDRCQKLNISLEHKFVKANINPKLRLEDILVKNSTYKDSYKLKNRLIQEGLLEYKCAICGNTGTWLDKPLSLHLDHINGDHLDNRLENLRILCPNCHSQTETYGSKRGTKSE